MRRGEGGGELPGQLVPCGGGLCPDTDAGETAPAVPVRLFRDHHHR